MLPSTRTIPFPLLVVILMAALSGCASNQDGEVGPDSIVQRISDLLGRDHPMRHVQRYSAMHDAATFRHGPDTPETWEDCRRELQWLTSCDYESWKDVSLATYFVTRAAVDDDSALSRGEAVAALKRLGTILMEAEDPVATPLGEGDVLAVLRRIRELHGPGGVHTPDDGATAAECTALVERLGSFRADGDPGASPVVLRARLKDLRGILNLLVGGGFVDEERSPEGMKTVDRTLIRISAQSVRIALLMTLRGDDRAEVRTAAARTLGATGAASTAPGLVAAYGGEESDACRREIVQSLQALAGASATAMDAAVPLLINALDDDDATVALNARSGLAAMAGRDLGSDAEPWRDWWSEFRRKNR